MTLAALSCSKCGGAAAEGDPACPGCGGRLVRACPSCGFKNSAAKQFCDSCGDMMTGEAKAPKAVAKPAARPSDLEPPRTMVQRLPPKEPPTERSREEVRPPDAVGKPPAQPPPRRKSLLPVVSTVLAALLLVAGAALYAWRWQTRRTPRALLVAAAGDYLTRMAARDYEGAYSLLSSASRAECTLEEFKLAQDRAAWAWRGVAVDFDEDDWALVRYGLSVEGRPEEKDWLHFTREDGAWKRAYWWHLMERIESALAAKDHPRALAAARAAAAVAPRDPMARGYLCEAAYYSEDWTLTEQACSESVSLLQRYPSRLSAESIYHLHALLGDAFKNGLKKYPEAAREYGVLLAFPDLSREDRCDLLLARADTRMLMGDYDEASDDFRSAGGACEAPSDLGYAQGGLRILSGRAGREAALAAQDKRMEDDSTLLEWSERSGSELEWVPQHVGGSLYSVALRRDGADLLTAQVDLWTHNVKVNLHVR